MENRSETFRADDRATPEDDVQKRLEVINLTKKYDKTLAVENVSFSIKRGEMVTLIRPSGCGKSTILRCIAGLEKFNVCIRPHDIGLSEPGNKHPDYHNIDGKISQIVHMGSHVEYSVDIGGSELICLHTHENGKKVGDPVAVVFNPEYCTCVSR